MTKKINKFCLTAKDEIFPVLEDDVVLQKVLVFPLDECGPRGVRHVGSMKTWHIKYEDISYIGVSEKMVETAKQLSDTSLIIMQTYVDLFHFKIVRLPDHPTYMKHYEIWKEFQKDLLHKY